ATSLPRRIDTHHTPSKQEERPES
ncbi:MAG TPA: chorismate--pyruvate lyase, partial [Cupriavidus sp.]|nr:chorismate--pyruvate lyase [Cupriavidus sp.]